MCFLVQLNSSAIRFTTFERVSGWLQEGQGKVDAINALAAGTVAGAVESSTCLTPLQNIQIKMMQMDRYSVPVFYLFAEESLRV